MKEPLPVVPGIKTVLSEKFNYPEYINYHENLSQENDQSLVMNDDQFNNVLVTSYKSDIHSLQTRYQKTKNDVTPDMVDVALEYDNLFESLNTYDQIKEQEELQETREKIISLLKAVRDKRVAEEELKIKQIKNAEKKKQQEKRIKEVKETGKFNNIYFMDIHELPEREKNPPKFAYYKMIRSLPKQKVNYPDITLGEMYELYSSSNKSVSTK